jgi:hypothetical protein
MNRDDAVDAGGRPAKNCFALKLLSSLKHCQIASNSNLATYLDHLVVGQFQNICNTNRIPRHRSKDSFLPTRNLAA